MFIKKYPRIKCARNNSNLWPQQHDSAAQTKATVLFGSRWDLLAGTQSTSLSSQPWRVSDELAVYRPFQLLFRPKRPGKALINPMEIELVLRGWEPAGKGIGCSEVCIVGYTTRYDRSSIYGQGGSQVKKDPRPLADKSKTRVWISRC